MSKYVIEGGAEIKGEVRVSGAKNSVLKLMAAATMAETPSIIHNVPDIADVRTMMELLQFMDFGVSFSEGTIKIEPASSPKLEAPYHLVQRMRASTCVLGALVSRFGKAKVSMPGGCSIGARPIDLHMSGLSQMGASIEVSHGFIIAETKSLNGTTICLDYASVGATENFLMAGALAKGKTIIENAAKEPEIVDLAEFLRKMGAIIEGDGTSTISIEGVSALKGAEHTVIGDRIEAGTYLIAGAAARGEIRVTDFDPAHLEIPIEKMKECGCEFDIDRSSVTVRASGRLKGIEVQTLPYPGFPTDLQPQMQVLLSTSDGVSFITENVFENRFMISDELNRLGANIKRREHHAIIRGVEHLSGAPVTAPDLRAGAALVIAGLIAEGITEVNDIHHIDRGYENFEEKISSIGGKIRRVN